MEELWLVSNMKFLFKKCISSAMSALIFNASSHKVKEFVQEGHRRNFLPLPVSALYLLDNFG